jgi:hypothetical protein
MMTDDDLRAELDRLSQPGVEGSEPFMYLDNAKPPKGPNVTTGVGFLLASDTAAKELPWQHADGTLATPAEVSAEFFRVSSMRGGLPATRYRGPLSISPETIEAEGLRRLRAMVAGLQREFPGFDGFPSSAQQCLLDLRWNAGSLLGWTHLRAACNSVPPDWLTASKECTVANPNGAPLRETRNAWRAGCFLTAAGAEVTPGPQS